ncbi:hypothetical protein CEP53_015295, partial [Fusarium sp. AF-6]
MARVDLYDVLEVSRTAGPDAIKTAYRQLAKVRHPDKNPGDPNATSNFQELNDAYSTLSDPLKRRQYDLQTQQPRAVNTSRDDAQRPNTARPSPWAFNNCTPNQPPETEDLRRLRRRQDELAELLQTLAQQRISIEKEVSSAEVKVKQKLDTLKRLQDEAAKDESAEAFRRGWLGFLWRLTPEQQDERDRAATARRTGMIVIKAQIEQHMSVLKAKRELLEKSQEGIQEVLRQKIAVSNEYVAVSQVEQRRKQEEERQRLAKAQHEKEQREKAAREAEAHRRREEAAEAYRARQAEARERTEAAEEAARRFKKAYENTRAASEVPNE